MLWRLGQALWGWALPWFELVGGEFLTPWAPRLALLG